MTPNPNLSLPESSFSLPQLPVTVMSKFIQSYSITPKEIFRLNNGPIVRLRAYPGPRRPPGLFDLLTYAGKVKPKALSATTYKGEGLQ